MYTITKIMNLLQTLLWFRLLFYIIISHSYCHQVFLQTVFLSIFDIFFVLSKISKGNLLITTLQVTSRLVVAFYFVTSMNYYSKMLAIIWSLSEITRYPYYIFPYISPIKWLRYNCFILLYPIGMFLEAYQMYYHYNPLSKMFIIVYPLFGPLMYMHMFKQRNKLRKYKVNAD